MKRCPITYEPIDEDRLYSAKGLKQLSPQLKDLHPLDYTVSELIEEAKQRASKISIQGVQTKLSAKLHVKSGTMEIVDQGGHYIIKPPNLLYPELPENEALTMSLAELTGIEVPVHGLLYGKDDQFSYFIKRFDRYSKIKKKSVEDFSQLSESSRSNKYDSSMEKVAKILFTFCSVPQVEAAKFFRRFIFDYLTGNEDMHLKNYMLITDQSITKLAPAYDLLSTTIAGFSTEEIALPLNGKKSNLKRVDFIDYYAAKHLKLNHAVIDKILSSIADVIPLWKELIDHSFLNDSLKTAYLRLVDERSKKLELV